MPKRHCPFPRNGACFITSVRTFFQSLGLSEKLPIKIETSTRARGSAGRSSGRRFQHFHKERVDWCVSDHTEKEQVLHALQADWTVSGNWRWQPSSVCIVCSEGFQPHPRKLPLRKSKNANWLWVWGTFHRQSTWLGQWKKLTERWKLS